MLIPGILAENLCNEGVAAMQAESRSPTGMTNKKGSGKGKRLARLNARYPTLSRQYRAEDGAP
jgi:hypothetical protein